MIEAKYEEYAVLSSKIKELKEQQDTMKGEIIEAIAELSATNLDTPFGKFCVSQKKTWTYTPEVEELADNLKTIKAEQESTGDATYEEKPSLRFTAIKL